MEFDGISPAGLFKETSSLLFEAVVLILSAALAPSVCLAAKLRPD